MIRSLLLFVSLFLPLLLVPTVRAQGGSDIRFVVSMPKPTTRLLHVTMQIPAKLGKEIRLAMPVWSPGSYFVREYSRNVLGFAALDAGEKPLLWQKTRKNAWKIQNPAQGALTVRYQVYANELSVRGVYLDDRYAFWNNTALLLHIENRLSLPATLIIAPLPEWKVATSLEPLLRTPNTFRAPNFDALYDAPVLVGNLTTLSFVVRGVPHEIVLDANNPLPDFVRSRLQVDVARIVESAAQLMHKDGSPLPYKNYTFLVMLQPIGGGGLEHGESATLILGERSFSTPLAYRSALTLFAHEFFHAWNVKRIKPDALGPFDYNKENYTRLLWVAEGVTDYYEHLIVRRAGLTDAENLRESLARAIGGVERTPGRKETSAEEASFDAWIKQYIRDDNSLNREISYYTKGSVLGLLLDAQIRGKSGNKASLDDVMRTLWRDFGQKNRNYTPADFQKICESFTGGGESLSDFFARYVRGKDELPYDALLAPLGLRLERGFPNAPSLAYFGAPPALENNTLVFKTLLTDSPAWEQGVMSGDVPVAVNGKRVTTVDEWNEAILAQPAGATIQLTVFRRNELLTLPIRTGTQPSPLFRLSPVANPTPAQKAAYDDWSRGTSATTPAP